MSDTEDLTQERDGDDELVKQLRAELRERNKALAEERNSRTGLEKKMVFQDLGFDPSTGPGKLFYESYSGDLSPEAIKAKAEEYGLAPDTTAAGESNAQGQTNVDEQRQAEARAHRAMDTASSGAPAADASLDPTAKARERYEETISTTGNPEHASAAYFHEKLTHAINAAKSKG